MDFYDSAFKRNFKVDEIGQKTEITSSECHELLSAFPQLLRVLRAFWICKDCSSGGKDAQSLFYIRLVLDISWDNMLILIHLLLPFKGNGRSLHRLWSSAKSEVRWSPIHRDIAQGCLRLLKHIQTGVLPQLWSVETRALCNPGPH